MTRKSTVHHFIDKEREKGTRDKDILHKLLDAGWHMDIVHKAMGHASTAEPEKPRGVETSPATKRQTIAKTLTKPATLAAIFLALVLLAMFI